MLAKIFRFLLPTRLRLRLDPPSPVLLPDFNIRKWTFKEVAEAPRPFPWWLISRLIVGVTFTAAPPTAIVWGVPKLLHFCGVPRPVALTTAALLALALLIITARAYWLELTPPIVVQIAKGVVNLAGTFREWVALKFESAFSGPAIVYPGDDKYVRPDVDERRDRRTNRFINLSTAFLGPASLTAFVAAMLLSIGLRPSAVLSTALILLPIAIALGAWDLLQFHTDHFFLRERVQNVQFLRALWILYLLPTASALISVPFLHYFLSPPGFVATLIAEMLLTVVFVRFSLFDDHFPHWFATESRIAPIPPLQKEPTPPNPDYQQLRGRELEDVSVVKDRVAESAHSETLALPWGGVDLPASAATLHFAALGATGSGKSVTHALLVNQALRMTSPTRALLYDAKGDLVSMLAAICGKEQVCILNPFDARSLAWNIASDVTDPITARQFAETLIPRNPRANEPFWDNAAREIVQGIIVAFQKRTSSWDLRDLLNVLTDEASLRTVLGSSEESRPLISQFVEVREFSSIRAALATHINPLRPIAAAWDRAILDGRVFSLEDWIKNPRVLVMGEDESHRAALAVVNRLIFTRCSELLLAQPDRTETRTWVFLDEVRDLGRLDTLHRLLLKGRSKNVCVVLGFQDIEGMREVYGDKVANELVGQCGNLAILKLNSPTTAEWASQAMGEQEVIERLGPDWDRTHTRQVKIRRVVLPSELLDIEPPKGLSDLTGYYIAASYGLYRSTLKTTDLSFVARLRDASVPDSVHTPADHQILRRWDDSDLYRLGIAKMPANPAPEAKKTKKSDPMDIPRPRVKRPDGGKPPKRSY